MKQIRSLDYMQSKLKQPSSKAIYRLIGMDLFGSDTKAQHISRTFQLPETGAAVALVVLWFVCSCVQFGAVLWVLCWECECVALCL